jgi:hypothetical protein
MVPQQAALASNDDQNVTHRSAGMIVSPLDRLFLGLE